MTLVLTRSDLNAVLDPDRALATLREGFLRDDVAAVPGQRMHTELPGPGTATALLPGLLPGVPAYTVKVNAKFPAAQPALRGVVCLHSLADGELLAVLDSSTVTAWRTGLAAALATDLLADPAASALGIVGAGAQAELVLRGLRRLRPLTRITVTDINPDRARRFAERHGQPGSPPPRLVDGAAEVSAACDIVVLATWSHTPLLTLAEAFPGQHLTSLGADEPGKRELGADLLNAATLVVDDLELARRTGVLCHQDVPGPLATTLGAVLRRTAAGRTDPSQLTVYAPVGLPWQDLALAWTCYLSAKERGEAADIDLLS